MASGVPLLFSFHLPLMITIAAPSLLSGFRRIYRSYPLCSLVKDELDDCVDFVNHPANHIETCK